MLWSVCNDTATTEIYTLSLRDALPISGPAARGVPQGRLRGRVPAPPDLPGPERPAAAADPGRDRGVRARRARRALPADRKSTRLNSSHANISYAVFCLKKKNGTVDRNS